MSRHATLHDAISDPLLDDKQCQAIVKKLLTNPGFFRTKANPNAPDKAGYTPLHCAASENNRAGVIRLLLASQASPHQVDMFGNTPLHTAVDRGLRTNVELLLELKANFVELLLGVQANFKVINGMGETPFRIALNCVKDHEDSTFLEEDLEEFSPYQQDIARVRDQYFPIAEKLFHLDTKPSFSESEYGSKEFEWFYNEAMARGRAATIEKLFAEGAPLLGPTDKEATLLGPRDKRTPPRRLHQAAVSGHVGLVAFFLRQKIPINTVDNLGHTPLFRATVAGKVDVVKFLLLRGAWAENFLVEIHTIDFPQVRQLKEANSSLNEVKRILQSPGPQQTPEERAKYVKIFRLLSGGYRALTLLGGLHSRAGSRSTLMQLAGKSTLFDRQVLRIPLRLAGCQPQEQPPAPPKGPDPR